ncbi:vacuolar protein sorting-associated protein 52-like protein [Elysia marginata]|uniref:Vacuolar protein sorting-associated protein 52 homolog n=1 Tax=Elysia marginata TaxID=1093978 RepID=A0AAV4IEW2_9GAST|nr:vacuolar protein sorting-associated protein 52-like protein [Elysia marginata]
MQGVDLRQYSKEIEQDLLKVENESVQDYIKESQNIASLHKQIAACDTILERMEQMLNGFQGDLSSISTEIQSLQDQSIAMNVKLKNRQAIRGELSQYVDEMVIHEQMITAILESPVTEDEFKEQLHELNHKINFVKEQSFRDARACHDVKDILEKLKIKVSQTLDCAVNVPQKLQGYMSCGRTRYIFFTALFTLFLQFYV